MENLLRDLLNVQTRDETLDMVHKHYPRAGAEVDGREVLPETPNLASIDGSVEDYDILKGIREVSMSEMSDDPRTIMYAADDFRRAKDLAAEIQRRKKISPLIIVVDKEGPYLLEGAHRLVALIELKAKSFPAVVVIDMESILTE